MNVFIHEVRKVPNKLIMIKINVQVMILNQDKTKGHLKLSTKQLETKPGDMLHVQAYQKVCFYTFYNVIQFLSKLVSHLFINVL
jgi:predicted RNA-binding protein with RPS1 domain